MRAREQQTFSAQIHRQLTEAIRELSSAKADAEEHVCAMRLEILSMETRCEVLDEICHSLLITIERAACPTTSPQPRRRHLPTPGSHEPDLQPRKAFRALSKSTPFAPQFCLAFLHAREAAPSHRICFPIILAPLLCGKARFLGPVSRGPPFVAPRDLGPLRGAALLLSRFPPAKGMPLRECRASISRSSGCPASGRNETEKSAHHKGHSNERQENDAARGRSATQRR